jgi:hypothetical protein
MHFVCQEQSNTIYSIKKRCYYWGPYRSQLKADNEFSLNLWKAVDIDRYNRCYLIGLWGLLEHYWKKQYAGINE